VVRAPEGLFALPGQGQPSQHCSTGGREASCRTTTVHSVNDSAAEKKTLRETAAIEEYVRRLVAEAPPFSPEIRARLASLLAVADLDDTPG